MWEFLKIKNYNILFIEEPSIYKYQMEQGQVSELNASLATQ